MNQPSKLTRARALEIASLDQASGRRKLGQFRIEGWRAVESAIKSQIPLLEVIVRTDLANDTRLEPVRESGLEITAASTRTTSKLTNVVNDQGIVGVASIPIPDTTSLTSLRSIVALDGVQDPGNVGTIVRCAAWFGLGAVVAGPGTADFYNPKVVRSMAGSMWDVQLLPVEDFAGALAGLRDSGFEVVGADLHGMPLGDWNSGSKTVIVLGSEAHGISEAARGMLDRVLRIEGGPSDESGVESLNVAIAGAVIMYRLGRRSSA